MITLCVLPRVARFLIIDNVRVTSNRLLNARGDAVVVENNYIDNPFRCAVAPLFTTEGTVIRDNYVRKLNRSDNGTFIPVFDIEPDVGPQNSAVYGLVIDHNAVDARTGDGTYVDLAWQVTNFSTNPDPIHGTVIRNNYGYYGAVCPQVPPAITDSQNLNDTDPSGWTMQAYGG